MPEIIQKSTFFRERTSNFFRDNHLIKFIKSTVSGFESQKKLSFLTCYTKVSTDVLIFNTLKSAPIYEFLSHTGGADSGHCWLVNYTNAISTSYSFYRALIEQHLTKNQVKTLLFSLIQQPHSYDSVLGLSVK